jgi:SOS-response transcriptional repressor LexA
MASANENSRCKLSTVSRLACGRKESYIEDLWAYSSFEAEPDGSFYRAFMADVRGRSNVSHRPDWARAIRDLRSRLGLSQTELGTRIGVSAMAVSRWERGTQEPTAGGYIALGNLPHDTTSWFFWERAGLRNEDVMRVLPVPQRTGRSTPLHNLEIVTAGSGHQRSEEKLQLVAIPLLKVVAASHGEKGDTVSVLSDAPVENVIAAPMDWCPHPSFTSCLRVRGNSMAPLIQSGSVVAVDSSETDLGGLDGKIVIAWHKDRGLTISRLRRYGQTEVLQPENAEYEAVSLTSNHDWKIVAKVLWWVGKAP